MKIISVILYSIHSKYTFFKLNIYIKKYTNIQKLLKKINITKNYSDKNSI